MQTDRINERDVLVLCIGLVVVVMLCTTTSAPQPFVSNDDATMYTIHMRTGRVRALGTVTEHLAQLPTDVHPGSEPSTDALLQQRTAMIHGLEPFRNETVANARTKVMNAINGKHVRDSCPTWEKQMALFKERQAR